MNKHLLVTDAENFDVAFEINPYMHKEVRPDREEAKREHAGLMAAHKAAGRQLEYLPTVAGIPDMIYVANAALGRGNKVLMGLLPPERQPETSHYREWFVRHGYEVMDPPYLFSGQGDSLPCGDLCFIGTGWRTDPRMHDVVRRQLGYNVIGLQTNAPEWYDIDLSLAVLREDLIAYCPDNFAPESAERLANLPGISSIIVSQADAKAFGLNLVCDGTTVVMTQGAPTLAADLRAAGFHVTECKTTEIAKGGGGVRCTSFTLDNL